MKTYLVYPVTIYGIADHALTKAGISNAHSIQVPALIQASLDRGRAGMVGVGKNIWHNVHINESGSLPYVCQARPSHKVKIVSGLYVVLYNTIASNPMAAHGREGIYIGENGQHTLYDVAKAIQEAMVELGLSKETEPSSFTREEVQKYFGVGRRFFNVDATCTQKFCTERLPRSELSL